MEIKKFENSLIAFDFESEYVNATDLIQAFNKENGTDKRIDNYLRNKQTKDFISALESDTLISAPDNQLIKRTINVYGKSETTWFNKWLAYDFAAWLSPKFRLFVYKTFDEYLQNRLRWQQYQIDRFWDKSDNNDLYYIKK